MAFPAYNKTEYEKFISLGVDRKTALALAADTAPTPGATASAIANQAMAAAAPTKAEYDALATKFNTLLQVLRDRGLIAP